MSEPMIHPVQVRYNPREPGRISSAVTERAYEVYRALYGDQQEIITGTCRGGFGASELIAFLYAMTFPRAEWRARVDEAFAGMRGI